MAIKHNKKFQYLDKKVGWILYPIIAISFIFFGNDNDFLILINLPSFKWDLVFSLCVVTIVGFYLGWITRYLDKKENTSWHRKTSNRFVSQSLYGIILPLIFSIGLEALYLYLIDVPFSESAILNLELPLAFIYLLLINLLYYLNFIYNTLQQNHIETQDLEESNRKIRAIEGAKEQLIPVESVAFIRSSEKQIWLHTLQEKQLLTSGTLSDFEQVLPKQLFFRINRQFIVNREAVNSFEITETRRLKVFLTGFEEAVFIPKTKATKFREWINT